MASVVVHRVVAAVVLACGGRVAAQQGAPAVETPSLRPGDTVAGEIVAGGPSGDAAPEPQRYRLVIEEAGTYRLELRSCVFDPSLTVRAADGAVIGEHEGAVASAPALVVFEAEAASELSAEAFNHNGLSGAFELSLQRGPPEELSPSQRRAAAIAELEDCLAAQEQARGPDDPFLAGLLMSLARELKANGDYAGARPRFERALAIREQALGPDHLDVADSLNALASLLHLLGDYATARPLYERALAIDEKQLGPDHPSVARVLYNLALLLQTQGDLEAARPLLERALAIREQALGPEHPDVATSLSSLALVLHLQGNTAAALPLDERTLAIREAAFGAVHPLVADALDNLTVLQLAAAEYAEARASGERSLAIRERTQGPSHPALMATLNQLAEVSRATGDYAAAQRLYERSLAIAEATVGPDHPNVATILSNLAMLRQVMGDAAGARPLCERALSIRERALGPDHPDVATSLNNLAALLKDEGDLAGARARLERSLAIEEKAEGPDHPSVALGLNNLGDVVRMQGDLDAARALYERSRSSLERALGPRHPWLARVLYNLAVLGIQQGDLATARPLLEQVVSIDEESLGPEHPSVARSLTLLALVDLDLGRADSAAALEARAAQGRAGHLLVLTQGSSEADLAGWLGELSQQIDVTQSPALRDGHEDLCYSALLAWKGQLLRAARAGRSALRQRLRDEDRALVQQLDAVTAALSRSATGTQAPPSAAQLDALVQERQRLERELTALAAGLLPKVPSWPELRDALPAGAALVDLFIHCNYEPARCEGDRVVAPGRWTEPQLTAWITRAGADGPLPLDLGPVSAIETAARGARIAVASARGERLDRATAGSEALAKLMWAPLAPHLDGIETVIVSPDGVLATIPFEVLRDDEGHYLVERRSFVYLSDPTDLTRLGPALRPPSPGLLCVGDVDFDAADGGDEQVAYALAAAPQGDASSSAGGTLRGRIDAHWERLAATAGEASAVIAAHAAAYAEASRLELVGAAATEERLKASLPEFPVLHLATHGYFNPDGLPSLDDAARREAVRRRDEPAGPGESLADVVRRLEGYSPGLLSGLVCAGANAPPAPPRDDGYLTAEEVGWLDLSGCDLVVLSACDTGLGRPQSGEGLLGLRRAFLTAGARTVVSSLWSVPDPETAELMSLFYANLWQRGLGKHAALRAAQLEMIARNRQRFGGDARPATWGAFVLDGDWR
jgi:CHAT domain-containing protein/tetratricopeptide (TPR) repeat protein